MLLDMPHGMCPYHEDHSLGIPRLLGRLSGGTSLRLRHPGDALNLRLLLLRRRALRPMGTLHQPQGDEDSAERPLRVQLSSQRQHDRPFWRQCHDSRLPQAIGRHKVSGPVPQSEGDSPVGRIHEDHAASLIIQGSLNTRADLLSRPNLVIGSEWTLHQEVVQDLLRQWPAIIDLVATLLTARLPVFFAPA